MGKRRSKKRKRKKRKSTKRRSKKRKNKKKNKKNDREPGILFSQALAKTAEQFLDKLSEQAVGDQRCNFEFKELQESSPWMQQYREKLEIVNDATQNVSNLGMCELGHWNRIKSSIDSIESAPKKARQRSRRRIRILCESFSTAITGYEQLKAMRKELNMHAEKDEKMTTAQKLSIEKAQTETTAEQNQQMEDVDQTQDVSSSDSSDVDSSDVDSSDVDSIGHEMDYLLDSLGPQGPIIDAFDLE